MNNSFAGNFCCRWSDGNLSVAFAQEKSDERSQLCKAMQDVDVSREARLELEYVSGY